MALNIGHKVENGGQTDDGKLTAKEFNELVQQINHNTPIEIQDEDTFNQMLANGELVEGQLYYIPEED
jgi:hypothetical protein